MYKYLILIIMVFFNFQLFAKECDHTDRISEIEQILKTGRYGNKKSTGNLCLQDNQNKIIFDVKKGRLTGSSEFLVYNNRDKVVMSLWLSNYKDIYNVEQLLYKSDIFTIPNEVMEKITMIVEYYKNNGMPIVSYELKNGKGSMKLYDDDGKLSAYRLISKGVYNGKAEEYDKRGRLFALVTYKDGVITSAECATDRKNGKEWTKAEISNWNNGLEVECSD